MILSQSESIHYLTADWVLPVSQPPIAQGFVSIAGNRIEYVGRLADLPGSLSLPQPAPGSLITPGLINTHVHLEQSFEMPIPRLPDETFVDWLLKVIETTRRVSDAEQKQRRCENGVQECLRTGTTCVNDIASGLEVFAALTSRGMRARVALEVFHPGFETIELAHWEAGYSAFTEAASGLSLIEKGLSPHSPYNVSARAWLALLLALKPTFLHTHAGEFEAETAYLQGKSSPINRLHQQILGRTFHVEQPEDSPIQALIAPGLLDRPTVIAHAIHTSPADRRRLAALPVGVAHCPRSNLALHGRTLRWTDWEASGIPIGLGTDGRLSTPDLDLRNEARCAMSEHGWSAETALEIATLGGARVFGKQAEIGSLESGKMADLVVWQADAAELEMPPEVLVFSRKTEAVQVMIDGQTRWKSAAP